MKIYYRIFRKDAILALILEGDRFHHHRQNLFISRIQ
jgi:hypothetical protein